MPDATQPSAHSPETHPAPTRPTGPTGPTPDPGAPPGRPGTEPAEEARRPDEYLETPGSHRRPDGAATDVGA
jgi:hypothetical protein